MLKLKARKLLAYTTEQLWDILHGTFELEFDDGVVITTNHKSTLYSSYVWDIHRRYPKAPLLHTQHVDTVLRGRMLNDQTQVNLLSAVVFPVQEALSDEVSVERMMSLCYQVVNDSYNSLVIRTEEYTSTLSAYDMLELLQDESIAEARKTEGTDVEVVNHVNTVVSQVLGKDPKYKNNNLVKLYRSGLINKVQAIQCFGYIGNTTDINSDYFPTPIKTGFGEGIRSLYDLMTHSRSAAKSLHLNQNELPNSEYFSRTLQLQTEVIRNLNRHDCGSTSYLRHKLRPEEASDDGGSGRKSDLEVFVGKNYLDEETNTIKELKATDTHLLGKYVRFRSAYKCIDTDPGGTCQVCYGALNLSLPSGTNLGQVAATYIMRLISQKVLSNKHTSDNVNNAVIKVAPQYKDYLVAGENNGSYKLNRSYLASKKVKLLVDTSAAYGLLDVIQAESMDELITTNVSKMDNISLEIETDVTVETINIPLVSHNRLASFSLDFLEYVRTVGFGIRRVGRRDVYEIDLTQWDYSSSEFILPLRHFNMADFSKVVSSFIRYGAKDLKITEGYSSDLRIDTIFTHLVDMINTEFGVNAALIEVVFKAGLIVSAENHDYRVSKPGMPAEYIGSDEAILSRSLGGSMGFEEHTRHLASPLSYLTHYRMSHPLDVLLMPNEIVSLSKTRVT